MNRIKKYLYPALPACGVMFYILYLNRAAIDMVYSDYIRLINSYLPDVWNPEKFFVPDLLTRIPVNYLERGLNVMLFGYSVTFDRVMGVLSFGLSALVIAAYSKDKKLGAGWYLVLMAVMFSLNKWEMLYNGTGWAHFLAFAFFFYHYYVLDRVYGGRENPGDMVRLFLLPTVVTIGVAGPYCAVYSMTIILAIVFIWGRNRLPGAKAAGLLTAVTLPLLLYLWSNSLAVYEYSNAVDIPLFTAFFQEPKFFLKFFLKSFASMIFGVELMGRHMEGLPGEVLLLLGLFVLAAYFLALWMNFYYGFYKRTIFPLMLLAGGGMNHLMVLVSRYIFMPNDLYGMSSRYALQYQVGILGILLTFGLAAGRRYRKTAGAPVAPGYDRDAGKVGKVEKDRKLEKLGKSEKDRKFEKLGKSGKNKKDGRAQGGQNRAIQALTMFIASVFLLGNLLTTAEEFSFGKYRREYNEKNREILLDFESYGEEELETILEYHKPGVKAALTILKENGWNIFRE